LVFICAPDTSLSKNVHHTFKKNEFGVGQKNEFGAAVCCAHGLWRVQNTQFLLINLSIHISIVAR